MEIARERRKDLVGLDFVGSRRGCWDPSPDPQSSECEPFLPLNLSVLICKMGTWRTCSWVPSRTESWSHPCSVPCRQPALSGVEADRETAWQVLCVLVLWEEQGFLVRVHAEQRGRRPQRRVSLSQGAGHWTKDNFKSLGRWKVTNRGGCGNRL